MKMSLICLASVLMLAACGSHSSNNASGDDGTVYDQGNPDAPAGHRYHQRCSDDFMNDYNTNVTSACTLFDDGGVVDQCNQAQEDFRQRHQNVQCSFDDGSNKMDYSDHHESHHGRH